MEEIKVTKVAIVGTAPNSMTKANDLDESWSIFCCNAAFNFMNRFDLHFEIHGLNYLKQDVKPDPTYFDFFKDAGPKLVLNAAYPDYPEAQVYPLQDVIDKLQSSYFNNTIAYMIAFALYRYPELTDLALLGVDMAGDGEYTHQRPCCEFWLGMAKARGIQIHLPETSPLLKNSHLYGFEPLPHHVVSFKDKLKTLQALDKKFAEDKRIACTNFDYNKGMLELTAAMLKKHQ